MTSGEVDAYLRRIEYPGSLRPDIVTLRALHRAHLMTVPFENLSIHAGEPIVLEPDALFEKIVRRRRGGFCYELNGLFAALLRGLGFDVTLLSAGVMGESGEFGPEFDHMALRVQLGGTWLADVGFGDGFLEPLSLDDEGTQRQGQDVFQILPEAGSDARVLLRSPAGGARSPQYRFTVAPHALREYEAMCAYHQTSPASPFTRKRVCSRATPEGRVTLSGMRLITTAGAVRHERTIGGDEEYAAVLLEVFGIRWGASPR